MRGNAMAQLATVFLLALGHNRSAVKAGGLNSALLLQNHVLQRRPLSRTEQFSGMGIVRPTSLRLKGGAVGVVECEFRVLVDHTDPGDTVVILGKGDALHNWNKHKAIELTTCAKNFPWWNVTVEIPVGQPFEYKFAIRNYRTGRFSWEPPCSTNRKAMIRSNFDEDENVVLSSVYGQDPNARMPREGSVAQPLNEGKLEAFVANIVAPSKHDDSGIRSASPGMSAALLSIVQEKTAPETNRPGTKRSSSLGCLPLSTISSESIELESEPEVVFDDPEEDEARTDEAHTRTAKPQRRAPGEDKSPGPESRDSPRDGPGPAARNLTDPFGSAAYVLASSYGAVPSCVRGPVEAFRQASPLVKNLLVAGALALAYARPPHKLLGQLLTSNSRVVFVSLLSLFLLSPLFFLLVARFMASEEDGGITYDDVRILGPISFMGLVLTGVFPLFPVAILYLSAIPFMLSGKVSDLIALSPSALGGAALLCMSRP
jgi:hypothetical protein